MSAANMVDLASIRQAVRFRGDYQNVRRFPDADLNREIQKSFGEFYALVDSTHEGWWDTEDTITTVTSQAFIAPPPTTWRVKGVDRLDGTEYVPMSQVGISDRNRFGQTTGVPVAFRLSARGLELYPTPDIAYTLRVTFTPKAPTLQEALARDWYNGWDDYVIESTLLKLDRREGKPLAERERSIEAIKLRVKSEASERKQSEPEYLVIRESGDYGYPWPWGDVD